MSTLEPQHLTDRAAALMALVAAVLVLVAVLRTGGHRHVVLSGLPKGYPWPVSLSHS